MSAKLRGRVECIEERMAKDITEDIMNTFGGLQSVALDSDDRIVPAEQILSKHRRF